MKILLIEDEKLLCDTLKDLLTAKGFQVEAVYDGETGAEYALLGSESHLRQVVDILLDNGCKYGALGQAVKLTLQRQSRGKMLLTVASKGAPLTPGQCKDIFKRFYRVDEARAMNHSYGLGLPIADSIVQEHGGKIWAAATVDGNVFSVQLPTLQYIM